MKADLVRDPKTGRMVPAKPTITNRPRIAVESEPNERRLESYMRRHGMLGGKGG